MREESPVLPMDTEATPPAHPPLQPGAVGPWLHEGLRTALFRAPRWRDTLQAHPAVPVVLVGLHWALVALLQRLYIPGPARFYAPALLGGWTLTAAMAWVCHLMRPPGAPRPGAAALFCMLSAQALVIGAAWGALYVGLVHAGAAQALGQGGWLALGVAGWAWLGLAQLALLVHAAPGRRRAALLGAAVLASTAMLASWFQPLRLWYPERPPEAADTAAPALELDQHTLETQSGLLARQASALKRGRPGVVELYAITFAPYGEEEVFRRESALVSRVMQERFDAEGRSLQLVNHPATARELPWATPLNLKRAIEQVAQRMNRDEDVLFIHLTSHGARDGQLAASLPPLQVEELQPQQLKAWLDEAGVRFRVLSVSACYSGSWIDPLAGDGTLVMTAADAQHTSYGCGRLSELTFFGRAMYEEQLRLHTRSFEAAHQAARGVIERREQQAGKDDGYSNPQLRLGPSLREQLRRLQQRLEAR